MLGAIAYGAKIYIDETRLLEILPGIKETRGSRGALTELLSEWARFSSKPIVLLLDEVDALVGDTLISLLRQIRSGYAQRPFAFPQSIVLCGVRDIRDYRMHTEHQEIITGGSAFNIKAESLRLGNFDFEEITTLFQQHTTETGQSFNDAIFPEIWEDTKGQPWLVNALGHQLTWKNRELRDRSIPIGIEHYQVAREELIQSRATHLDQLADKLKEPRVHSVISNLLSGEQPDIHLKQDDLQYVEDLGLITRKPQVHLANRIYQEIIPREITSPIQDVITHSQSWYITPDHKIDMPKLILAFQQFFRENAEIWLKDFPYKESGPHLLMQAFLQRIINGGGRINREYALGRKRTDLLIEWPVEEQKGYFGAVQRIVIELKILRKSLETTITEGIQQTLAYAQTVGAAECHLVIFNRNPEIAWDDKIWHRSHTLKEKTIDIWGC